MEWPEGDHPERMMVPIINAPPLTLEEVEYIAESLSILEFNVEPWEGNTYLQLRDPKNPNARSRELIY